MDNDGNFFYKLDIFNYLYSEDRGELGNYIVGKSISNDEERYIADVSINPNRSEEIGIFQELINLQGSIRGKTIGIDYHLLNDRVIDILQKAYEYRLILGIRLLPNGMELSKEVYDKLNKSSFSGFLVCADRVSKDINLMNSIIDLRELNDVYEVEHIQYEKDDNDIDHYNVHISRKLSFNEIKDVVDELKDKPCSQIYLDYYNPSYYKMFLKGLHDCGLDSNVSIVLLGNPLYDEKVCYEEFDDIISNPIRILYNTCDDLNNYYREGPYTEGIHYYSDLDVSGEDKYHDYYEKLKFIDNVVLHMEEKNYSPLEKIIYVDEMIKDHFQSTLLQENIGTMLHTVYENGSTRWEELADLYSVILRKSGVLCFTYSTDSFRKNMVRVKDDKYGIDQIALMDVVSDFEVENKKNSYNGFLVPIENDIYNQEAEIISIPTSLCIDSADYYKYVDSSNPSDPIGLGVRMLQLMGLGHGNELFDTREQEIEFYKTALANSSYMDDISPQVIADAIGEVRKEEGKYHSIEEYNEDLKEILKTIPSRGNDYYLSPSIKLIGPPETTVDVELYKLYSTDSYDTHFVERDNQNDGYHRARRKRENESKEEYEKYLEDYYEGKDNVKEGMNDMKEYEEYESYEIDDLEVDELILYRDVNDTGRVFANKEVFHRFGLELPKYVIEMDNGENIYELRTGDVVDILNGSKNDYNPYVIRYYNIELHENVNRNPEIKNIVFYRNMNDLEQVYVSKEVLEYFNLPLIGTLAIINGVPCYEINEVDISRIKGRFPDSEERMLPLDRKKRDIRINDPTVKEKLVIYRNIDHPEMLYVRKNVFERFHLDTDVEEVVISGIPCYVVDRGDLSYIVGNANNKYSPYEIEFKDVEVKSTNIKAANNVNAVDTFKIYRNINNRDKWYVRKEIFDRFHLNTNVESVIISGVPCYVIDENDLAYIVGNANNKYSPYKIEYVDVELDSKNMRPGENDKAIGKMTIYRNLHDENMFFVRSNIFEKYHLDTDLEAVRINGDIYYVIKPADLEYIIGNANNKQAPYQLEFKDIPIGKVGRKRTRKDIARDLLEDEFIPGTNIKKPRARDPYETDSEYVQYLEDYYNEVFGSKHFSK
ncbi:MAG: hypothetical protein IJG68_02925 [Bacilli bacterium]|nr:hypothetical protein [Bacilli bacterium]